MSLGKLCQTGLGVDSLSLARARVGGMSTQKRPRDPNVKTQLDSNAEAVEPAALGLPKVSPAPKAGKAKKAKRPWSKPA